MKIESSAFKNTEPIPQKYTCDGNPPTRGMNPPLSISDVHQNAKSLVLIMDDPDAPGGVWTHWVVWNIIWNISPSVTHIPEGRVPDGGIEGRTSSTYKGYGGPCPPSGAHRYFFKLYALDTVLNIPLTSPVEDVEESMKGHIIADARIMGTYEKNSANKLALA